MGGDENNGPAGLGRTSTERRWIRKYGGMCQFHGAIPSVGKIYTFCYLTVTRDSYMGMQWEIGIRRFIPRNITFD